MSSVWKRRVSSGKSFLRCEHFHTTEDRGGCCGHVSWAFQSNDRLNQTYTSAVGYVNLAPSRQADGD
ncbi:hypothetical protein Q5P01_008398 [Channa striata]|uniref:Uncharacterized protein n=1 Tax=Channa striata TaxID=64152 RepID=A0AA88NB73_CHASR|nr:hypothetical protein Q5P01_008398 [Channa striata]